MTTASICGCELNKLDDTFGRKEVSTLDNHKARKRLSFNNGIQDSGQDA